MSESTSRPHWPWLVAVFLVAFAVRVGVTAAFQGLNAPPKASANPDQMEYEGFAYQMSLGKGYSRENTDQPTACRAPGTSFTLLPVYLIFGRSFLAARLWWCGLSAATCVAAGWLAARCFGGRYAVPAALWLTFYPGHFYYVMHFLSETPAALYLTLASGFSLGALRGGRARDDVLAALFWGLAALTRPNLILAAPLAPLARVLFFRSNLGRDLGRLLLQGAVVALVIGPWLARNAVVMGKPAFCTVVGGFTFWGAHNPKVYADPALRGSWVRCSDLVDQEHPLPPDEVGKEAAAWRYGTEFVRAHATEMPTLAGWKLYRLIGAPVEVRNGSVYWAFLLSWYATAPFALAGLVLSWRRSMAAAVALVIPVLVTVTTAIVFYGSERFRDSISPILAVYAALGAVALLEKILGLRDQSSSDRLLVPRTERAGTISVAVSDHRGPEAPVILIVILAPCLRLAALLARPWCDPERAWRPDWRRHVLLANLLEFRSFGVDRP